MSTQNLNDKSRQVHNEVDQVVEIMQGNIQKVMQRGEQLDTLQNKTGY
jgi:hypothetical protein